MGKAGVHHTNDRCSCPSTYPVSLVSLAMLCGVRYVAAMQVTDAFDPKGREVLAACGPSCPLGAWQLLTISCVWAREEVVSDRILKASVPPFGVAPDRKIRWQHMLDGR